MAQIADILGLEHSRTAESRNVINLFQEGSFYRAYEWSAWLFHRHISQFKVTHRRMKNIDAPVLFLGFPMTSMEKLSSGYVVRDLSEKHKALYLGTDKVPDDMDMEVMEADYASWKDSIPVVEAPVKSASKSESGTVAAQPQLPVSVTSAVKEPRQISMTGMMHDVIAFPLESKTPLECMNFLAEMKRRLACMI